MVWTVTLEIVDCASSATKLAGASVFDGANTWFTDANGQLIYIVDDSFSGVIVRINHGVTPTAPNGYIQKNYTISVQNAGTIQTVCLSVAPPSTATGQGCFTADTQVTLADGSPIAIDQLRVGDHLLGQAGQPNRVTRIHLPHLGSRNLYSLNGGRPFVTGGHPFMTETGWKTVEPPASTPAPAWGPQLVGRLALQDRLLRLQGCGVAMAVGDDEDLFEVQPRRQALVSVEGSTADPQTPLFDLTLDGDHTYFADGWLVHNKSTGGCFIVSATTGSSESTEVTRLRALRDRVAARSGLACQLIERVYQDYFEFSPAIATSLEQDELARHVVLWTVVRPLLAWYGLAAELALADGDEGVLEQALQTLQAAFPREPDMAPSAGTLRVLQSLVNGQDLPDHSPALLRSLAPGIRHAASLPFAHWALLDPLARMWRAAAGPTPMDGRLQVAQWLCDAPLQALQVLQTDRTAADRQAELDALARLFDFCPAERRGLGRRLAIAWPDAGARLAQAGFIDSPTSTLEEI